MKVPKDCSTYFFVDESGDPDFYDRKGNLIVGNGASPILILGFIETQNPQLLREAILRLQREVAADRYLKKIPSHGKTCIAFHAKDDCPEVRYLFYKLISTLDFQTQFIVARKIEKVFRNDFGASKNQFYDHLATQVFQNVLHQYRHNYVYFAVRGSRARQRPLEMAIQKAKERFEQRHHVSIDCTCDIRPQSPKGEPCLSIIDYMNWALYRAFTMRDMRYYEFVADKVSFLGDVYDSVVFPKNRYHKKNPFDISKATPL